MSTRPDLDQLISEWLLAQVPDNASERLLEASRARIRTTQQRRARWPVRRVPTMNKAVPILAAAAAVVAIALIGFGIFGGGGIGAPLSTDSLTPSTPLSSSEAVRPVDFSGLEAEGTVLQPGEYVITYASPVEVTFTVPDEEYGTRPSAWYKACCDSGPHHQSNQATVGAAIVDNVMLDPCTPQLGELDPAVGPTVDDLVDALGAVPGVEAGAPTDATIDGYAGQLVVLTGAEPGPAECVEAPEMWVTSQGEAGVPLPAPGNVARVWILDVEGTRLVIWTLVDRASAFADAAQAIVDSFQIDVP